MIPVIYIYIYIYNTRMMICDYVREVRPLPF